MTKPYVMIVDDDRALLDLFKTALGSSYQIITTEDPQMGLAYVADHDNVSVVVSDLEMPQRMNGIDFLSHVRAVRPDTSRIMLTGKAELDVAVNAVNQGNVFRFLTKPCLPSTLAIAIDAGIAQHQLITSQKVLLEQTLHGSVKVLTEILELLDPEAFGRSCRIARLCRQMSERLNSLSNWEVEVAGMLSQIGRVVLSDPASATKETGDSLHSSVAHRLIARIPRLESIAQAIAYQEKNFDGTGSPADAVKGNDIPVIARLLRIAADYVTLLDARGIASQVYDEMSRRPGVYDPQLFITLGDIVASESPNTISEVRIDELKSGAVLADDLRLNNGTVLLTKGREITLPLLERIKRIASNSSFREPIRIRS